MTGQPYGIELVLDLAGCDLSDLSTARIREYFVELCDLIQMKRHGEPVFWSDESGDPRLHGISGFQFIETSNVVCHALSLRKAVYLNIFSCKSFEFAAATQFSTSFWRSTSASVTLLTRH